MMRVLLALGLAALLVATVVGGAHPPAGAERAGPPPRILPLSSTGPGNTSNGSGPPLGFLVSFLGGDLPQGGYWSVTLGYATEGSRGSVIEFPNTTAGTYAFRVSAPAGYSASPAGGTVGVSQDVRVAIAFLPPATGGPPGFGGWPPGPLELTLIGGIVALGAVAIAANEGRERRRRRRGARGSGGAPPDGP